MKRTIIQFRSYIIVGLFSVGIYFSLFALLWQLFGINYQVAISLTYLVVILFHFSANRRYTFQAQGTRIMQHMTRYGCMVMLNYVTTMLVMHLVVEVCHMTPYIGVFLAISINILSNFFMSRYWVFRIYSYKECVK